MVFDLFEISSTRQGTKTSTTTKFMLSNEGNGEVLACRYKQNYTRQRLEVGYH